jgi:hypothetical protein
MQPPDPEGLMERLDILLQRFRSNDFDLDLDSQEANLGQHSNVGMLTQPT